MLLLNTLCRQALVRTLVAVCLFSAGSSVWADGREQAVRDTILSQIEAFAIDDAEAAWSYASDAIQAQFGSPDVFISMVRQRYPAIYRATEIEFRELVPHDGFVVQTVRFKGPQGGLWDSVYTLTEQEDGWHIGGVALKQANLGI
ncbi:DUF4864 domain-containing protein [Marinobacter caseinilyticus]|uniref:DUF4864 domain-containing protein n=1 Tax=Marinobacter caseinilyticus TaxID=2692195 RepID=UPI001409F99F|nr:DUF4864 domain-containing protein [Marinobacter caseinilyticus]